jgi:Predicted tRNA(5-methylaminomethyl-2-thiouridylate) methyltransferase, contains the PP-loop ATPase domain
MSWAWTPKNRVIVGPNNGLFSSGLFSKDFRFQDSGMATVAASLSGLGKIRQNHTPALCTLQSAARGIAPADNGAASGIGVRVQFELAQRAVAPGQSFVLYSEDGLVLGGGVIDEAIADDFRP